MHIRSLFVPTLAFVCSALAAQVPESDNTKEAVAATWHAPNLPMAGEPTDLDLDTSFYGGGLASYWPQPSGGSNDWGLRVEPYTTIVGGGVFSRLYIMGAHEYLAPGASQSTRDAILLATNRDGTPLTGGPTDNWVSVHTEMTGMNDAVFDPEHSRAYFLGWGPFNSTFSDNDIRLHCVSFSGDHRCAGWPATSSRVFHFDRGGSNNDVGLRMVLDPQGYLFIGGYADASADSLMVIGKLNTSDGSPVMEFGTNGFVMTGVGSMTNGRDNIVNSMALVTDETPGGRMLYLGGAYKVLSDDYDGFIMAMDPETGATGPHHPVYYELDNTGFKLDSVTAITILGNGKIAAAGITETDTPGYPSLLLVRVSRSGMTLSHDLNFCHNGTCVKPQYFGQFGVNTADILPLAIDERPDNRDLVVSMQGKPSDSLDCTSCQIIEQYGANGNVRHAVAIIAYPGSSATTPGMTAHGTSIASKQILVPGSRAWTSTDWDVTVTSLNANDSIFASQFGGSRSD